MESKADILEELGIAASLCTQHSRKEMLQLYVHELMSLKSESDTEQLHLAVKSCLQILKSYWPEITRSQCRRQLIDIHTTQERPLVDDAIDIALRISLMIDSRDDSVTGYPRHWNEDETIQDVVYSRFQPVPLLEAAEISHFPRHFRAVDLARISGINVQWTTYLDEHLRFDDDTRTLRVFNNKAWLLAVMSATTTEKSTGDGQSTFGLPRKLLEETIKTLDVLFPPWHDRTVKFLNDLDQDFYQLPPIPRDLPRLREFTYWRERFIDVIVEFESPPRSWKYVWRDRRYPMAFWTFWLGLMIFILTFLFGFIGTVMAGMSLRAAVEQLKTLDRH